MARRAGAIAGLALAVQASSCAVGTAPADGANVRIVLAISGGIAGSDMQYTIDGGTGRITGDRCRARLNCDWEPGAVLADVAADDVRDLGERIVELGFFRGDSDYGVECCDQFDYAITYEDEDDRRTVTGTDGTLPGRMHDVISEVQAFFRTATSR